MVELSLCSVQVTLQHHCVGKLNDFERDLLTMPVPADLLTPDDTCCVLTSVDLS